MENSIERFQNTAQNVIREVSKVIVGQEEVIQHVLIAVLAGGHVLLEGVPGLGKTLLIKTLGDALDLKFSRIQFTPDLMPADIVGTEILIDDDGHRDFRFQPGPIFANLVLADEINRATPKTQSALLEAMQEASVTVAQITHKLTLPFFVLATQNPIEMEGTYPLPEAQLDRFMFKVNVGFPSAGELVQILNRTTGSTNQFASPVASGEDVNNAGDLIRSVPIASHVEEYVANLIIGSHPGSSPAPMVNKFVRYGSSPRGGQSIILGAKARALLDNRFNVSYDDINHIAPSALRHRILLNFDGLAEGINQDAIIDDLLAHLPS